MRTREPAFEALRSALARHSPQAPFALAVLVGAAVLVLDLITGAELAFSLFYVVPVAVLVWFVGVPAAVLGAATGAGLSLYLDLHSDASFSHAIVPYWNALATIALYVAAIALLRVLKSALSEEKKLARTDGLTGIANTRRFFESAERELARSARYEHPFTVVYVDVDDFKLLNDRFGHAYGDEVLRKFAVAIEATARHVDLVARLGGDEFAILLPETSAKGADGFLVRLRSRLEADLGSLATTVTASIGAVTFEEAPESFDDMVAAADSLMYDAKKHGKNGIRRRVVARGLSVDTGSLYQASM